MKLLWSYKIFILFFLAIGLSYSSLGNTQGLLQRLKERNAAKERARRQAEINAQKEAQRREAARRAQQAAAAAAAAKKQRLLEEKAAAELEHQASQEEAPEEALALRAQPIVPLSDNPSVSVDLKLGLKSMLKELGYDSPSAHVKKIAFESTSSEQVIKIRHDLAELMLGLLHTSGCELNTAFLAYAKELESLKEQHSLTETEFKTEASLAAEIALASIHPVGDNFYYDYFRIKWALVTWVSGQMPSGSTFRKRQDQDFPYEKLIGLSSESLHQTLYPRIKDNWPVDEARLCLLAAQKQGEKLSHGYFILDKEREKQLQFYRDLRQLDNSALEGPSNAESQAELREAIRQIHSTEGLPPKLPLPKPAFEIKPLKETIEDED